MLGAAGYFISNVFSDDEFSTQELLAATAGGAVAGAIAGLATGDASVALVIGLSVAASTAGKITENTVNETASYVLRKEAFTWSDLDDGLIEAAIFGALGGSSANLARMRLRLLPIESPNKDLLENLVGFSFETTSGILFDKMMNASNASMEVRMQEIRKEILMGKHLQENNEETCL